MNILKTALILMITLVAVPLISYRFGEPLDDRSLEALKSLLAVYSVSVAYCFIVGEMTGNNSQVDKFWSVLPIAYAWIMAHYGDYAPRLILMAFLVSVWGIRLSYNFSRRGGYSWKFWTGEEDYRWEVLRVKKEFQPRWKWTLFNLFFICIYQLALILLFTMPMLLAVQYKAIPLSTIDIVLSFLMFGFIVLEAVADQQQWNFQKAKHLKVQNGEPLDGDYARGFLSKGLWAYSRHPNYFAEQAVWITFYGFSVIASGQWINWSIVGCLLLLLLFQESSKFSEEISASKYPDYINYQNAVPRFIGPRH